MEKLVTVVGVVVAFGCAFVFGVVAMQGVGPKSDADLQKWVEREVAKSKNQIPMDCGNGVTWYAVEGGHKKVIYSYRINRGYSEIKSAQKQIERAITSSPMIKWQIPTGVKAVCCFYDRHNQLVFRAIVDG